MNMINPTAINYGSFQDAYDFFNAELFDGRLPSCLITFQRKSKMLGYYAAKRFGTRDGKQKTDEIAMNPKHFIGRSDAEILSTLVHEMVHLEQAHFGSPPANIYHNAEWASMMEAVGLIPSDTARPGGKRTGQSVSHYIQEGGRFEKAVAKLIKKHRFSIPYIDVWQNPGAKKKADSKTKYTCPGCGTNAWAKPDVRLVCQDCEEPLLPPTKKVEV